jgi:hypothetical protein
LVLARFGGAGAAFVVPDTHVTYILRSRLATHAAALLVAGVLVAPLTLTGCPSMQTANAGRIDSGDSDHLMFRARSRKSAADATQQARDGLIASWRPKGAGSEGFSRPELIAAAPADTSEGDYAVTVSLARAETVFALEADYGAVSPALEAAVADCLKAKTMAELAAPWRQLNTVRARLEPLAMDLEGLGAGQSAGLAHDRALIAEAVAYRKTVFFVEAFTVTGEGENGGRIAPLVSRGLTKAGARIEMNAPWRLRLAPKVRCLQGSGGYQCSLSGDFALVAPNGDIRSAGELVTRDIVATSAASREAAVTALMKKIEADDARAILESLSSVLPVP